MARSMASSRTRINDPWIARHGDSELLRVNNGPSGCDSINTQNQEVYGEPGLPLSFRIGNGGAGYTGLLKSLSESFIAEHGSSFRIGWVPNHSRHSQVALLADVVQVALTYEPDNEDLAIAEGWCSRTCRTFNDHFILVGPDMELGVGRISEAMKVIAQSRANTDSACAPSPGLIFNSRGDGSATFGKEQLLWKTAGVDFSTANWIRLKPLTPYEALVEAEKDQAFLLTDRATFLTAKCNGVIPSLRVHVENGEELLNPCSALVREGDVAKESKHDIARKFASWLGGEGAQRIVADYGKDWPTGQPLFTVAAKRQFDERDRLAA